MPASRFWTEVAVLLAAVPFCSPVALLEPPPLEMTMRHHDHDDGADDDAADHPQPAVAPGLLRRGPLLGQTPGACLFLLLFT